MGKCTHEMVNCVLRELSVDQLKEYEDAEVRREKKMAERALAMEVQQKQMDSLKSKLTLSDDDLSLLKKMLK